MGWSLSRGPVRGLGVAGVTTCAAAIRRASIPRHPNELWIADLAPLSVLDEPLYLGVVLDCCTRRCLGWRYSATLEPELIAGTIEEAVIVHSPFDSNSSGQPLALALAERCAAADLGLPTEVVQAADRAVSRDFFNWLGADLLSAAAWQAPDRARTAINRWILGAYNPTVASPPIPVFPAHLLREDAEGRSA